MISRIKGKTSLAVFITLSLAGHLAAGYLMGYLGLFDLRSPVSLLPAISVTLDAPPRTNPQPVAVKLNARESLHNPPSPIDSGDKNNKNNVSDLVRASEGREKNVTREPVVESPPRTRKVNSEQIETSETSDGSPENKSSESPGFTSVPVPAPKELAKGPVRTGAEFVPSAMEKLTYRIMLYGIPAGTAVLEATNKSGEVRITTKVTSNDVISGIYPVDIFVDTRLMVGNYLLTRIRQHEGSTVSDTGFTLMLREKNAFWVDRLNKRYANTPLPSDDVMDMISGFYYMRNQRLEVGKPVLLNLFDSCKYIPTTVEVLRKEHLRLPGFREADTLVVHPILKTDGFFHSTGDIFVWLTDDEKKVPVKMEARISLGKVTAELVSAESENESVPGSNGAIGK
jgi:hypothetical protein